MSNIMRNGIGRGWRRTAQLFLMAGLVVLLAQGMALAGDNHPDEGPVPEIDLGSISGAVSLLVGGLLLIRARIWPR